MQEVERLAAEIAGCVSGDPWFGRSVLTMLNGVGYERAMVRPPGVEHSIAEQVVHVTAWADWVARRLTDEATPLPADHGWPAHVEPGETAWVALKTELVASHERLAAAVTQLAESDLDADWKPGLVDEFGQRLTRYRVIAGVPQHTAYHCGQIALLAKLLGAQS